LSLIDAATYDRGTMKFLLVLGLVVVVGILPFVWLKRPWALRLWHRAGLIFAIYALVILLSAVLRLVFNWHSIYG
jgi:hypothetical protein